MRVPLRLLIAALALTAFLLADAGEAPALPMAKTSGALVTVDEGTQVARRRKRRKRRRTRPKPKPAPEPEPAAEPAAAPGGGGPSLRRTTRIEFDAQLIKGQTTKAGEVQILERKDTELKSMVKRRTSFREEIIHTVFPEK
jgi:hypothetical protein